MGKTHETGSEEMQFEIDQTVGFFDSVLNQPDLPDLGARAAFYDIAKGSIPEIETALLNKLADKRPDVAQAIRAELEELRSADQPF